MTYRITAILTVHDAADAEEALEVAGFALEEWDAERGAPMVPCDTCGSVSVEALPPQMQFGETA